MTQEQASVLIVFTVAIIFVFTSLKKLATRLISIVVLVVTGTLLFSEFKPITFSNMSRILEDKDLQSTIGILTKTTSNIKLENNSIKVRVVNTDIWLDLKDIEDVVSIDDNKCTIKANNTFYVIEDKSITELITKLKDYEK